MGRGVGGFEPFKVGWRKKHCASLKMKYENRKDEKIP
jgi:hypothetical protein